MMMQINVDDSEPTKEDKEKSVDGREQFSSLVNQNEFMRTANT